jgi:adenine-specific DNA-methyltransferase
MSRLTDLIASVKSKDPQIGAELENEFREHASRLAFGLNFERHRPEVVELPRRSVRKGDKVRKLPPRGEKAKSDPRIWIVKKISEVKNKKIASIEIIENKKPILEELPVDDLVVIAEFRDYLYPGLVSTGKVERGGDKPFHTVINGENYHVLKALTYSHKGKIDVIYIDPPYNTGAKDWKYNNDYVESEDLYRHSKWLAFMERRLFLAKELLNPSNSVLIVTIDEKEYLRLGLLLEQTFPEARIQMVSSVINPAGSSRPNSFSRTDEYIYFVQMGTSSVARLPLDDEWRVNPDDKRTTRMMWSMLKRTGTGKNRADSPNLFYPIFVDVKTGTIASVGETLPLSTPRTKIKAPPGQAVCFPVNDDNTDSRWQMSQASLKEAISKGYVRVGRPSATQGYTISYLKAGEQKKVEDGTYTISGKRADGSLISDTEFRSIIPGSAWRIPSHDASRNGSNLLRALLPDRKFPFPKSLYAVEDALRFFSANKPNAIILDFFSGSGTTAHAVMRLNRQDGGSRQCISVTNNEVGADEQKSLRDKKLRPGDDDWEKWGICNYITKPRVEAAITGKMADGKKIVGEYQFTDKFPMSEGFEENAEFFDLTYETSIAVSHNLAFNRVAPLLWMRAGSQGKRINAIPKSGFEVVESYGILIDLDKATDFCKEIRKTESVRIAYIVTNDDRRFQIIIKRLPESVEPVRLYESYLKNFEITGGE